MKRFVIIVYSSRHSECESIEYEINLTRVIYSLLILFHSPNAYDYVENRRIFYFFSTHPQSNVIHKRKCACLTVHCAELSVILITHPVLYTGVDTTPS